MGKRTVSPGGESEADRFAALVREHYYALHRAAYRLTRSTVDAEDLVQEVCVRAYPRLGVIEQLEQPRGWLLRVLYRLFVDLRRRYERTHVRAIDEEEDFVSGDPGPLEEADRALDRWRIEDLRRELDAIGCEVPLEPHGQGFKDFAPAVDKLENAVAEEKLRHGGHPLLTMCCANTVVTRDPAGNRKLDKAKSSGRIDGIVGLAMALNVASRFEIDEWVFEPGSLAC